LQFAACGSHLILAARRSDRLEALKKKLDDTYGGQIKVFIHTLDVTKKEAWHTFLASIPEELKNVSILVNNAGLALSLSLTEEYNWEEVNAMIDTNVKGAVLAIQSFVPGMKKRAEGHIINISSTAGKTAYPKGSIYCASKFALEAISDALRQEVVDTPLRVTKVCPGAVETEFSITRFHGNVQAAKDVYKGFEPLVARDIADNVVYCASRPHHVQISDMVIMATSQATANMIHRKQ